MHSVAEPQRGAVAPSGAPRSTARRSAARMPNQALRTLLLRKQSAKLACLAWEVEEARRKAAWCGRPETLGAERTAWLRALYRFSGSWVPCV